MSVERNKSVSKWIVGLLIGAPVLYFASFGPACWITSRTNVGASAVPFFFRPMTWASSSSESLADALSWYAESGAAEGWHWDTHPFVVPQNKWTVSVGYRWAWQQNNP